MDNFHCLLKYHEIFVNQVRHTMSNIPARSTSHYECWTITLERQLTVYSNEIGYRLKLSASPLKSFFSDKKIKTIIYVLNRRIKFDYLDMYTLPGIFPPSIYVQKFGLSFDMYNQYHRWLVSAASERNGGQQHGSSTHKELLK